MRKLEAALARLVKMDRHDLLFRHDFRTDEWTVGVPSDDGTMIHAGTGANPAEAAWALVAEVERHEAWAREYFARK